MVRDGFSPFHLQALKENPPRGVAIGRLSLFWDSPGVGYVTRKGLVPGGGGAGERKVSADGRNPQQNKYLPRRFVQGLNASWHPTRGGSAH